MESLTGLKAGLVQSNEQDSTVLQQVREDIVGKSLPCEGRVGTTGLFLKRMRLCGSRVRCREQFADKFNG